MCEDLANAYALGRNEYPKDIEEATNLIINYQNRVNVTSGALKKQLEKAKEADTTREGADFAQQQGQRDMSKVKCYRCGNLATLHQSVPRRSPNRGRPMSIQRTKAPMEQMRRQTMINQLLKERDFRIL